LREIKVNDVQVLLSEYNLSIAITWGCLVIKKRVTPLNAKAVAATATVATAAAGLQRMTKLCV